MNRVRIATRFGRCSEWAAVGRGTAPADRAGERDVGQRSPDNPDFARYATRGGAFVWTSRRVTRASAP